MGRTANVVGIEFDIDRGVVSIMTFNQYEGKKKIELLGNVISLIQI